MQTGPARVREDRRWLLPLVAILIGAFVVFGLLAALAASAPSGSYGWMMGGNWGWMWGAGALMMVIPVVFLLLVLFLLLRPTPPSAIMAVPPPADPTLEIRMRYARGEITTEQYRQMLTELQRS